MQQLGGRIDLGAGATRSAAQRRSSPDRAVSRRAPGPTAPARPLADRSQPQSHHRHHPVVSQASPGSQARSADSVRASPGQILQRQRRCQSLTVYRQGAAASRLAGRTTAPKRAALLAVQIDHLGRSRHRRRATPSLAVARHRLAPPYDAQRSPGSFGMDDNPARCAHSTACAFRDLGPVVGQLCISRWPISGMLAGVGHHAGSAE